MLRNYRNYQPSWNARNAAQYHQRMASDAQGAINREAQRINHDYLKWGGGSPDGGQWYNLHMAQATAPHVNAQRQHNVGFHQNMANAMMAEQTQVDDRKMDLADNEQGRKNLETEYTQALDAEKIRAAERMNNRNNQGLEGLMDGMNTAFEGVSPENTQVPNYDLYSNNGNRMGGSYFGRALLG